MISHRNVIANVCQIVQYDKPHRDSLVNHLDVSLGLMPQSHIYALVRICHASTYRGDQVISLPRFDLNLYLNAIQQFKINTLYVVRSDSTTMHSDQYLGAFVNHQYWLHRFRQ